MRQVRVLNSSKATVIGTQVAVADSFLSRLFGLMGRRSIAPGGGLLILPSSGVHTCWMRMKIDVAGLDRKNRVVKLGHSVKPWRVSALSLRTASVLELPAGHLRACNTAVGDLLEMHPIP